MLSCSMTRAKASPNVVDHTPRSHYTAFICLLADGEEGENALHHADEPFRADL